MVFLQIEINAPLCKGCGFCVKFCQEQALAMGAWPLWPFGPQQRGPKGDLLPVHTPERCTGCATCAQMCPEGAITIKEEVAAP